MLHLFNELRIKICMGSSAGEGRKLSGSFVMGVAAIVFLIIGYQTALLVHSASVVRIAALRDCPDTVFVYMDKQTHVGVNDASQGDRPAKVEKKMSRHSAVAEAVRRSAPGRKVESFRFNPNTVSLEDLVRLGFSSKQAGSILKYRDKGGRFRRKTDFARSYVVSDSIYKRLEPFIDIPLLDLNLADSAAFDSLPGIGGWLASKILDYKRLLGSFSYKEQLMDIPRFDQERFDALQDIVCVSEEYVTPYPLWTYPADSLRLHPYIRNYETARAIVLFRETAAGASLSVGALAAAGILSETDAEKLSKCLIQPPHQ